MLTDQQKVYFSSLRVEIIDISILAYFFIRKMNRLGYIMQKSTRHFLLEEFVALRYMENGLILHLTNLDDDSSVYSFRKILKEVNKRTTDQKQIRNLKSKLDDYRKEINYLKVQHRNTRIAHMNYLNDLNIEEFLNFHTVIKPRISSAFEIADMIWGEQISYGFYLGKFHGEGTLDFRQLFETLHFDINSQKEFI